MRILEHIVTPAEDGQRVKHLLRSRWQLSTTLLKHLKWNGGILLNGRSVPVNTPAHTGDVLTADVSRPAGEQRAHLPRRAFRSTFSMRTRICWYSTSPAGIAPHPLRRADGGDGHRRGLGRPLSRAGQLSLR